MLRILEDHLKKRLKDLLEKGKKPAIVGSFTDYFGNSGIVACSICQVPVFVRPWILEAIVEHDLPVICMCCVDPKNLKGQIAMDFAKIEEKLDELDH